MIYPKSNRLLQEQIKIAQKYFDLGFKWQDQTKWSTEDINRYKDIQKEINEEIKDVNIKFNREHRLDDNEIYYG